MRWYSARRTKPESCSAASISGRSAVVSQSRTRGRSGKALRARAISWSAPASPWTKQRKKSCSGTRKATAWPAWAARTSAGRGVRNQLPRTRPPRRAISRLELSSRACSSGAESETVSVMLRAPCLPSRKRRLMALRSILPLGVIGSLPSRTKARGCMCLGSRSRVGARMSAGASSRSAS